MLHSAAYKHVPVLEYHPDEAVKTNVLGTRVLAGLAVKYGMEKFIFISTDKAINPTSIMGASKRSCEEMLKVFDQENKTRFISVRFGNVLGSRGSVIPVFEEIFVAPQIEVDRERLAVISRKLICIRILPILLN